MSTIIAVLAGFSFLGAMQLVLALGLTIGLLMLFKPLLRGCARALVLVVRPKLTREQRMLQRQV